MARDAKPNDAFVLMLIGHGSFDGYDYKINLPGPDLSGVELGALLDRIGCTRQLVVNMTSASGGSRAALEKANRVVITATKSGNEKNATVFARFWVEALRDPSADTDKNETVSALEAFTYADTKTAQFYETQKRLATEHPILEDTGQGDGERKPSPENGEGLKAAQFALLRIGAAQIAASTPEKKALLEKRDALEEQIDKLKYEKAAMPADEYKKQLQDLLHPIGQDPSGVGQMRRLLPRSAALSRAYVRSRFARSRWPRKLLDECRALRHHGKLAEAQACLRQAGRKLQSLSSRRRTLGHRTLSGSQRPVSRSDQAVSQERRLSRPLGPLVFRALQ